MADYISARQARLTDYTGRPRPIKAAAARLSKVLGVAGALVTALVGWGILTAAQGDAVTGLLGAIPGVVTAVTAVLTAFGVVRRAEPLVTPLSDPRNAVGEPMSAHSPPGDFGSGPPTPDRNPGDSPGQPRRPPRPLRTRGPFVVCEGSGGTPHTRPTPAGRQPQASA